MSRISPSSWFLIGICAFALVVRMPTIGYGLPLHLYGDEEANVYGALEMLQLHTFLPVLHPQQFNNVLYEPPLTAYLFAAAFVPTIAVEDALHGFPPLSHLANTLLVDPSIFWLVARALEVLISIGSILLVYRIGKQLFARARPALLASAFLATSFLDTTIAATARHWSIGIFFSLAALTCALSAFRPGAERTKWLFCGGALLGLSFGASYLVYLAPLIFFLIIWKSGWEVRTSIGNLLWFFGPSALIAALFVAVDPYPLYAQAINHVTPTGERLLSTFLSYYGHALWQYELPLVIFGIIGALGLLRARRDLALLFATYFATALFLMYFFMPNLARYLTPLIPMLALIAAYGLDSVLRNLPRSVGVPLLILLAAYAFAIYGRYELLMLRNDVRADAVAWVERNIPAGSTVLVESDTIRLYGTPTSLAIDQALEPERLHSGDRSLLAGIAPPPGMPAYNLYYLSATSSEARASLVKYAEATTTGPLYLVADRVAELQAGPLGSTSSPQATVLKTFAIDAAYQADAPFVGGYQLFIGGGTGDESSADFALSLWSLLYHTRYLGTDVTIYRL